jgi:hypothetical protein
MVMVATSGAEPKTRANIMTGAGVRWRIGSLFKSKTPISGAPARSLARALGHSVTLPQSDITLTVRPFGFNSHDFLAARARSGPFGSETIMRRSKRCATGLIQRGRIASAFASASDQVTSRR